MATPRAADREGTYSLDPAQIPPADAGPLADEPHGLGAQIWAVAGPQVWPDALCALDDAPPVSSARTSAQICDTEVPRRSRRQARGKASIAGRRARRTFGTGLVMYRGRREGTMSRFTHLSMIIIAAVAVGCTVATAAVTGAGAGTLTWNLHCQGALHVLSRAGSGRA